MAAAASTAIAASVQHARIPILDTITSNISPRSHCPAMMRDLHLIIIDEASMILVHALCSIDVLLHTVIREIFGVKILSYAWTVRK